MAYQEEKFHKLKYPGAIDADGHFVEGAKLWLTTARRNTSLARCNSNGATKAFSTWKSTGGRQRFRAARPSAGRFLAGWSDGHDSRALGSQCSIRRMSRSVVGRDGCQRIGSTRLDQRGAQGGGDLSDPRPCNGKPNATTPITRRRCAAPITARSWIGVPIATDGLYFLPRTCRWAIPRPPRRSWSGR